MSGVSWIQVDVAMPGHPKTAALAAELGEDQVEAYLVRLWCWCAVYEPSGCASADVLERACGWKKARGNLVRAMVTTGWLDEVDDGLAVHNWDDRSGAWVKKVQKERARSRKRRLRARPRTDRGQTADGTRSDHGQTTAQDRTGQDTTGQDGTNQTDQKQASAAASMDKAMDHGTPAPAPRKKKPAHPLRAHPVTAAIVTAWQKRTGAALVVTNGDLDSLQVVLDQDPCATPEEAVKRLCWALEDSFWGLSGKASLTARVFLERWSSWRAPGGNGHGFVSCEGGYGYVPPVLTEEEQAAADALAKEVGF
jgi:hypothetical protein